AGLRALKSLPANWIDELDYTGPKGLLAGDLLTQQGKKELAALQYETALAEVKRRKPLNPADAAVRIGEIWALVGLGRLDEARAQNRVYLETLTRPYRTNPLRGWRFTPIPCGLLIGERATALQL